MRCENSKVALAMLFRPHPIVCSRHPSCAREASKWTHGCPSVVRQTTQNDWERPEWTTGEIPCPVWGFCGSASDLRTLVLPSHGPDHRFDLVTPPKSNPSPGPGFAILGLAGGLPHLGLRCAWAAFRGADQLAERMVRARKGCGLPDGDPPSSERKQRSNGDRPVLPPRTICMFSV